MDGPSVSEMTMSALHKLNDCLQHAMLRERTEQLKAYFEKNWRQKLRICATSNGIYDDSGLHTDEFVRPHAVQRLRNLIKGLDDCIEIVTKMIPSCPGQFNESDEDDESKESECDESGPKLERPARIEGWPKLTKALGKVQLRLEKLGLLAEMLADTYDDARYYETKVKFKYEDYEKLDDPDYQHHRDVDVEELRRLKKDLVREYYQGYHIDFPKYEAGDSQELPSGKSTLAYLEQENRQQAHRLIFATMRRYVRLDLSRKAAEKRATARDADGTGDALSEVPPTNEFQPQLPSTDEVRQLKLASQSKAPSAETLEGQERTFHCPYCGDMLLESDSGRTAWYEHVNHDLLPFTCLWPCCKQYDPKEFEHVDELTAHLEESFGTVEHWVCDPCLAQGKPCNSCEFLTKKDLDKHLDTVHWKKGKDATPMIRLEVLTECPLCPRKLIYKNRGPDSLLPHVANHMERFTSLALPEFGSKRSDPETWVEVDEVAQKLSEL
ncbi:hypothetical protein ASPBRDRAFT_185828 [Aspergillus brasiliensis CBS 101740]|uniref:C2H2-type domain-containing protein n=1 Tax=Aspergillus brasiliensis (strain CBS 101740 / IMI 381727 / IBT 21946) TaxID=767769 RepID=A0A1L9U8I6_ASPBC|nr:hypothetical protein ASPBRDRAFT_185828 [Aspergillus brasiliensis CBS 101740]